MIAWGKRMVIDTSYRANATGAEPPPPLQAVRAKLLERYAQTGPIFA